MKHEIGRESMTRLRQYLTKTSFASGADRQSVMDCLADMEYTMAELRRRLEEEIKWGHRECTIDACRSSGTDCPANAPADRAAVADTVNPIVCPHHCMKREDECDCSDADVCSEMGDK
jgi:hypothetical protein